MLKLKRPLVPESPVTSRELAPSPPSKRTATGAMPPAVESRTKTSPSSPPCLLIENNSLGDIETISAPSGSCTETTPPRRIAGDPGDVDAGIVTLRDRHRESALAQVVVAAA